MDDQSIPYDEEKAKQSFVEYVGAWRNGAHDRIETERE